MKRRILATTLAMVMVIVNLLSVNFMTVSADTVIFSDDFAGGKTSHDYTLYDDSVAAEVAATAYGKNDEGEYDVPSLQYLGDSYNGDANGGWKVDITDYVTSGTKLGLTFDYLMDYYDAKVFIEVRNASGAAVNTYDFSDAPKTTEAWKSYTSSVQPTISFTSGQSVYLCVMQESGFWFVSNIELSSIGGSSSGDSTGSTTTSGVIFSDDFSGGKTSYDYTLYDDSVAAEVAATASGKNDEGDYDVESLQYKGDNYEGNANGGWKVDITDYVTSGMKLGLSFDYLMDYYDAKVFIEVRNASGAAVNTYDFSDAPKTTEAWKSYTSSVQPTISFTSGQSVYLCVMQESGFWFVSNIELSSIGSSSTGGSTGGATTTTTIILNDTFSGGKTSNEYTLYDDSDTASLGATAYGQNDSGEYDVECLKYQGENYEGSTTGGWKIDITDKVTSGTKLGLTFDYMMNYYDGKVFVEVRNASGASVSTFDFLDAPKTTDKWAAYTSSVQPTISFTSGQSVYLCVMQESGYWMVSNIELSAIGSGSTGGSTGSTTTTTSTIFSDDFSGGKTSYDYTLYDDSVAAEVTATASGKNDEGDYDVESLQYKGDEYNGDANGGWKVDITDYVTSGMKLGLSFDYLMDYYDAKVFIEVRNASGAAVSTFDFSDAPKTTEAWKSYTSSVQPTISFTSGQSVYLCVMQESGFWFVTNIELTSIGSSSTGGSTPVVKEWVTVLNETYNGGVSSYDYTLYDTSVAATVAPTEFGPDSTDENYDVECLEFKGDNYKGDDNGGWKLDITSLVTSGDNVKVSFDYKADYYNMEAFIEVRSAAGTAVKTYELGTPELSAVWTSFTSDTVTVSYTSGQSVYLCVKHKSGYWHIDNLKLMKEEATSAIVITNVVTTKSNATITALEAGTIKTTVTLGNLTSSDKTVYAMTGVYNSNTLVTLSAVAEVTVGAGNTADAITRVSVEDANYVVKTFIWDLENDMMNELTMPVTFDKNGLSYEQTQIQEVDMTSLKGVYNENF